MSLSAEFLAPETGTEPPMAWPTLNGYVKVYPFQKACPGGWAIPGMMYSKWSDAKSFGDYWASLKLTPCDFIIEVGAACIILRQITNFS